MPGNSGRVTPDTLSAVQSALRLIVQGTERYRRSLAEQLDVSVTEMIVLGQLFNFGPMTPRDISTWLGFSTGATTGVLDRAEQGGFLTRQANPADRRSVLVTLTARGTQALNWIYERTNAYLGEALEQRSDEDLALLASIMREVGESLQTATPELPARRRANAR
jgi:DNA-binding MarR family transcriptional regulator